MNALVEGILFTTTYIVIIRKKKTINILVSWYRTEIIYVDLDKNNYHKKIINALVSWYRKEIIYIDLDMNNFYKGKKRKS